jgi:holin-like protein
MIYRHAGSRGENLDLALEHRFAPVRSSRCGVTDSTAMLNAIAILLVCQLAGEVSSQMLAMPIPGPVIGMVLLLVILRTVPTASDVLSETSNGILRHLSLLFVPAGVGVMLHVATVKEQWLAILVSVIIGTAVTLAVTALVIKLAMRLAGKQHQTRP